jgi:hypothetical protein
MSFSIYAIAQGVRKITTFLQIYIVTNHCTITCKITHEAPKQCSLIVFSVRYRSDGRVVQRSLPMVPTFTC